MKEPDFTPAIGVIAGLRNILLWIGGSVAGISTLFYVCGYLITTAHIYALGLSNLVAFDKQYFFLEGAKFLLAIVTSLGPGMVDARAILLTLAAAPIAVSLILFRRPLQRIQKRARNWYEPRMHSEWATAVKFGMYAALLVASAVVTLDSLQAILRHLQIGDLLYYRIDSGACDLMPRAPHEALMCTGNSDFRRGAFNAQLWAAIKLIALACLTWRLVGRWRLRSALIAPLFLFTALVLIMLPMDFGALMKPTRYPVVHIRTTDPKPLVETTRFLIDRDDRGFTIWEPTTRRIVWIPAGDIARMDAIEVRDLFADPNRSDITQGGSQ